jgi:hypothetical protein
VEGCALGSISMTCYTLGIPITANLLGAGAATLPRSVPAEDTNT